MVGELTYKRTLEKLVGKNIPETIKPQTSWKLIYTFARKYGVFHLLTVDNENCMRLGLMSIAKYNIDPLFLKQRFTQSIMNGYVECVKEFLASGKIHPSTDRALMLAIRYENAEIVSLLLDDSRIHLGNLDSEELDYLINFACKHPTLIGKLIVDPRIKRETILKLFLKSVSIGYIHSVKVILNSHIDITPVKYQALINSAKSTSVSIVSAILNTIETVDRDIEHNLFNILAELIRDGKDIRVIVLFLSKLTLTPKIIKSLLLKSIAVSRTDIAHALIRNINDSMSINLDNVYARAVETGQAKIVAFIIDTRRVKNFANISIGAAVSRNFVRTVEIILDRIREEDVIKGYEKLLMKAGSNRNDSEMYNLLLNFQKNNPNNIELES